MRRLPIHPGAAEALDGRWPRARCYALIGATSLACWAAVIGATHWLAPPLPRILAALEPWVKGLGAALF